MAKGKPGPVIPERYAKALARRDPIRAQSEAPKRIARLLRGLREGELAARPAPGKWSIKEVIAHLADSEVVYGARVRFAAAMDRPAIVGFDQDAFVEMLGVERATTKELMEAFRAVRAANVALLRRLPRKAFRRVGVHSERGEESVATMVEMFAGHDLVHEEQLRRMRAELTRRKS